jgi:tetratricopeptide (TPR) repeat protein
VRTKTLIAIALAALTLAVFFGVRTHEFVDLDDQGMVYRNAPVRPSSVIEAFELALTKPLLSNWMPLTVLSFQLDWALYGVRAPGYLITNVGLHGLAAIALFLALSAITSATWRSAFVAAVFAVHPLHVETAVWLGERKGTLSGLFFMLTLAAYARYVAQPASWARYGLVLSAFALALLSKPIVVTLPFVLLLLDYWPLQRLNWNAVREKIPMFALVVAVSVVTFAVQRETGAMRSVDWVSPAARFVNAVDSYAIYLRQSFWPTDLAGFYPHLREQALSGRVALEAVALLGLTAWAFALRRTRPYLLVGWLWYLGVLVPVIGFVQVGLQSHADRYMYLPLIGLTIALTWGVADVARSRVARRSAAVLACVAVIALAVLAREQVETWRDARTFWNRVVAVNPAAARGYKSLAVLHARKEEFEQAERLFMKAHELDPIYTRQFIRIYFVTLASWHQKRGHSEEALRSLERAVEFDPEHPGANRLLGLALMRRGRALEANPHLEIALAARSDDVSVITALAAVAKEEGRLAEAVRRLREAQRLAPESRSIRNSLAWILATSQEAPPRDPVEAVRLAEELRNEMSTPSFIVFDTLAAAYAAAGRYDDAVAAARQALDLAETEASAEKRQLIAQRLARYRDRQPHVQPPPADP